MVHNRSGGVAVEQEVATVVNPDTVKEDDALVIVLVDEGDVDALARIVGERKFELGVISPVAGDIVLRLTERKFLLEHEVAIIQEPFLESVGEGGVAFLCREYVNLQHVVLVGEVLLGIEAEVIVSVVDLELRQRHPVVRLARGIVH